jgi:diguanylate cyclase (GGDEF)-like protein/PAS domain S-box-containing protein
MRLRVWQGYLLAGLLVVAGAWLLPWLTGLPPVPTRVACYGALSLAAVVAMLAGVRRYQPELALPWLLLAAARAVYVVGDLTYYANALVFDDPRFPSLADVFYLGQYALFAVALLLLIRHRSPGQDRASLVDALIITVGFGLLSWLFLLGPYVNTPGLSLPARAVSVAYPLSDLLVLALAVRLTVDAGTRQPAFYLLAGGLVTLLATDSGYALAQLNGAYQTGSPIDTGWMLASILLGAAALHPSMRALSTPDAQRPVARLSRRRLAALAGAALMAPVALVLQAVESQPIDVPVIAGASVLLFLLTLARLGSLAGEVAAQAERGRLLERLHAVIDASPVAIVELDPDSRVRLWNPAAERIYGWRRQEVLGQRHPASTLAGWPPVPAAGESGAGEPARLELRQHHKDGSPIDVELATALLRTPAGEPAGMIAVAADISDRKRLEQQLRHQAFHDALTGLPNRALFGDRLGHALARIARSGGPLAVLLLDLDGFKTVNDTLGHAAGDQLLAVVAERLRATVRPADTVARLGGDEFVVLLEDAAAPGEAVTVAERLLAALGAPVALPGHNAPIPASASVGIVTTADSATAGDLLRDADIAMYLAKGQGGGRYRLFEPTMRAAAVQRVELEADLRRAVEQGEFTLHYQPIVELDSGRLIGVEALVRWQHPTRGLLAPGGFIPLAEETGLLVPIGRWVLRRACRQVRAWQRTIPGYQQLSVSVNLSAVELAHPDLVAEVAEALTQADLEPHHLTLELTEGVLVDDTDATVAKLAQLKGLGVQLAIDDFGTGYSSLSYLRRLPVDILKIDKTFVDALTDHTEAAALTHAIIKLAGTLHLTSVAEGIEDQAQLQRLRDLHCHYGQGYHLAKPLDEQQLTSLLQQRAPSAHLPSGDQPVEHSSIG